MEEIVYMNGSLIPRSQARVSVFDHAFLYGYGLFETMRAYRGRAFLLERHLKRLLDFAEIIGLGSFLAGIDLAGACRDTLAANGLEDARVRLTVSSGQADAVPWREISGTPNVVVTARPYTPFTAEKYEEGFKAGIASVYRCRSLISRMKSINYLTSALARREALAAGLDEALLLNDTGLIAEGGGSNVFFIKGSGLVTPSLDSGILPGITREVVIELAGALSISIAEGDVSPAELEQFDEAFLTNSMIEIMPLVSVRDNRGQTMTIGSGKLGQVTKRLRVAYKERVERETA
jgi:branched-chain amino acid aminotransferase group I